MAEPPKSKSTGGYYHTEWSPCIVSLTLIGKDPRELVVLRVCNRINKPCGGGGVGGGGVGRGGLGGDMQHWTALRATS